MQSTNKFISGYWENWKQPLNPGSGGTHDAGYYMNDIRSFNHIYYSFLTLDRRPNPDAPHNAGWDGQHVYESMTADPVEKVMNKTDPAWENPDDWQFEKIYGLI